MGLDTYFRTDIANALMGLKATDTAAEKVTEGYPAGSLYHQGYHDGFGAALIALALTFGLTPTGNYRRAEGPAWLEEGGGG